VAVTNEFEVNGAARAVRPLPQEAAAALAFASVAGAGFAVSLLFVEASPALAGSVVAVPRLLLSVM
jgi:hypothetical protein